MQGGDLSKIRVLHGPVLGNVRANTVSSAYSMRFGNGRHGLFGVVSIFWDWSELRKERGNVSVPPVLQHMQSIVLIHL